MSEETNVQKPSIIGIITSPVEQFERMKQRPVIWGALLTVLILSMIGGWLMALGAEVPEIEGLEAETQAGVTTFTKAMILVGSVVGLLFAILIYSAIYMLIAKIAQSEVTFKQLFSMNTYIMVISALSVLLNGIIIAVIGGDPEAMPTSLGSLISTEGAMAGFWDRIEVFSIWVIILSALGLQKVAGFSKALAWTVAIAFFVISIIFAMIAAAMNGMAGV